MEWYAGLRRRLGERLAGLTPGEIVFVGAGNRWKGDDAIGPALIDLLASRVPHAIDAGSSPENVTGAVKKLKPAAIVFIDALVFKDWPPGTPAIVEIDEIRRLGGSTHTLSLDVVMEYLKAETGADVFMIGVQPLRIGDGEGLSPGMKETLEKIAHCIHSALGTA